MIVALKMEKRIVGIAAICILILSFYLVGASNVNGSEVTDQTMIISGNTSSPVIGTDANPPENAHVSMETEPENLLPSQQRLTKSPLSVIASCGAVIGTGLFVVIMREAGGIAS